MLRLDLNKALLVSFELLYLHQTQVCLHATLAKHCSEPWVETRLAKWRSELDLMERACVELLEADEVRGRSEQMLNDLFQRINQGSEQDA